MTSREFANMMLKAANERMPARYQIWLVANRKVKAFGGVVQEIRFKVYDNYMEYRRDFRFTELMMVEPAAETYGREMAFEFKEAIGI